MVRLWRLRALPSCRRPRRRAPGGRRVLSSTASRPRPSPTCSTRIATSVKKRGADAGWGQREGGTSSHLPHPNRTRGRRRYCATRASVTPRVFGTSRCGPNSRRLRPLPSSQGGSLDGSESAVWLFEEQDPAATPRTNARKRGEPSPRPRALRSAIRHLQHGERVPEDPAPPRCRRRHDDRRQPLRDRWRPACPPDRAMMQTVLNRPTSLQCDRSSTHLLGQCRSGASPRCEDRTPTLVAALHVNGTAKILAGSRPEPPKTANPYAPKLTVEQRREAVRMVHDGRSMKSVARHFGVWPNSIENLVRKGRYAGEAVSRTTPTVVPTMSVGPDGAPPPSAGSRTGVDLLIHGLPLENFRALQERANDAGWSVADFAREILACAVPPSMEGRPRPILRVGLRHLISTWRETV